MELEVKLQNGLATYMSTEPMRSATVRVTPCLSPEDQDMPEIR